MTQKSSICPEFPTQQEQASKCSNFIKNRELQTFKISTFRHFINFSTKQLTSGLLMGSIRFSALKWLLDWSKYSIFLLQESGKIETSNILAQTINKFHSFSSTSNCLVWLIRAWALCIFACTKVASKSALQLGLESWSDMYTLFPRSHHTLSILRLG